MQSNEDPRAGPGSSPALAGQDVVQRVEHEAALRLLAEELAVDRRQVETGRVQVRRVTRERLAEVDEPLTRVTFEIKRVPVDRIVESRPLIRETETEIVVPIVEEEVVVMRRLRLKEELHIRKNRTVEHHREQVLLRAQEAVVARLPPKPLAPGE